MHRIIVFTISIALLFLSKILFDIIIKEDNKVIISQQFSNLLSHNTNNLIIYNFNATNDFNLNKIKLIDNISNFNQWIDLQYNISFNNLYSNIKNKNLLTYNNLQNDLFIKYNDSINEGVIIASPSTHKPNYFFQWIRDSAMVILTLINCNNNYNISHKYIIESYINNSLILQRCNNPSGNFTKIDQWNNLGEPKFNVFKDNLPFIEPWGRPQNDGPALRLISILTYFNSDNDNNLISPEFKSKVFNDICQYDINFILLHWNDTNFDLWEEINSKHFFTSMVQLYSLKLSREFILGNNDIISYNENLLHNINFVYDKLLNLVLLEFVDMNKEIIVETPGNIRQRPSGLDIAVILASILTHPIDPNPIIQQYPIPFNLSNHFVLTTFHNLIKSMNKLYPINSIYNNDENDPERGIALGRYPEDIYDGIDISEGNPWFLSTAIASNLMYRLVHYYRSNHKDIVISINDLNNDSHFWSIFINSTIHRHNDRSLTNLIIPYNSRAFNSTIYNLFKYGDTFLQVIERHASDDGEMSEQFNKYTGFLTGASNLTWSYAEFINAIKIRRLVKELN